VEDDAFELLSERLEGCKAGEEICRQAIEMSIKRHSEQIRALDRRMRHVEAQNVEILALLRSIHGG
jgi:hypothetical protein